MAVADYVVSRRALIAGSAGAALASGVAGLHAATRLFAARPPQNLRTVSVRDFGATGDGVTDDTAALQAAHDSLVDGGIIELGTGTYRVSRVDIAHRYIEIRLGPDASIRKAGRAGAAARGIFYVHNLLDAHFVLSGGTIDLNGEGPMGIGLPDRIPNDYAPQTIRTIRGLAGPGNAAVFALRASHITVTNVTIRNSGENGILFRNCGDTLVEGCRFSNIANYGVEWSLVLPGPDGGLGMMPARARNYVRRCEFEDLDDYALGSGNGVAVGGGGGPGMGALEAYEVTDCQFRRCQRDINLEFPNAGTWIEGLKLSGNRSFDARQDSFALIGVSNAIIEDYVIVNPGYAPTAALSAKAGWASIFGGSLSGNFEGVRMRRVQVIDNRKSRLIVGGDGAIRAGSKVFTSSAAAFTAADVGTMIGIEGANPTGVCYVGRIAWLISTTQVLLDLPAAATVSHAVYAYGGACREGLRIYSGTSVDIVDCRVEAGTHSGLPGEPFAAAVRIEDVRGRVTISGLTAIAPKTIGSAPAGVRVIRSPGVAILPGPTNHIEGFVKGWLRAG